MIIDGWLDWAIRMPGRPATGPGFNTGVNDVHGLVFHSAEGFAATMLSPTSQWGYFSAEFPWHLSNLLDGRLIQHYPFTVRCWHGSAFNQSYVGMEHEGLTPEGSTVGPILNDLQVANAVHVTKDLSEWKSWIPRRPTSSTDLTATLYEHNEVVRFGSTSTQCPSHRIPWDKIMTQLEDSMDGDGWRQQGKQWILANQGVDVLEIGDVEGNFPGRIAKNFGGQFWWLRAGRVDERNNKPAYWSTEEGD